MSTRPTVLLGLALLAALLPEGALACAVCGGGGSEETRDAFLLTTLFLSVLPPAIVGGVVWWIWRRARAVAETSGDRTGSRRPSPSSAPVSS